MELKEILQPIVSSAIAGHSRSKAILEDYAKVVSQLTGEKAEAITERINKRTEEIAKEIKDQFPLPDKPQ